MQRFVKKVQLLARQLIPSSASQINLDQRMNTAIIQSMEMFSNHGIQNKEISVTVCFRKLRECSYSTSATE
uniref:Uncharacterized protein n=1 Tax=Megaselia scalaris TaxID=36166 RepID=T1GCF6_MEGSC